MGKERSEKTRFMLVWRTRWKDASKAVLKLGLGDRIRHWGKGFGRKHSIASWGEGFGVLKTRGDTTRPLASVGATCFFGRCWYTLLPASGRFYRGHVVVQLGSRTTKTFQCSFRTTQTSIFSPSCVMGPKLILGRCLHSCRGNGNREELTRLC